MSIFSKWLTDGEKDGTEPTTMPEDDRRYVGKITKLSKGTDKGGWGFIGCKEIPFTRIFFHWTALVQDTLNFLELEEGMDVEFTSLVIPEKGHRALKIRVLSEKGK